MAQARTNDAVDVVVIGGGVAGSAAAARLGVAGIDVLVLERERVHGDKVRGEALVNWGYEQAVAMGLGDVVLGTADAWPIVRVVGYDETMSIDTARERARDLSTMLPGTPGMIGIGHPDLCESLAKAALGAGATVLRGVRRAAVTQGAHPLVDYEVDGRAFTVRTRLVLAADSANSATRRALGADRAVRRVSDDRRLERIAAVARSRADRRRGGLERPGHRPGSGRGAA